MLLFTTISLSFLIDFNSSITVSKDTIIKNFPRLHIENILEEIDYSK
jgi:hypothetical protein